MLTSAAEPVRRQAAVAALHDMHDPAAVSALIAALDDPDSLVRHHAARGLLTIHDLPDKSNDRGHMMYRVMSDDRAQREDARRDILAAIDGRPIAAP